MSVNSRRIGVVAVAFLSLAIGSADAQPIYGGGYWGSGYGGYGYGGGQTVQGSVLQGAGMYAMGAGQYNLDTAQARSVNASTAMRWNQYIYNSRLESAKIYHQKLAREEAKEKGDYNAIRERLRNNPNSLDVANGNALNIAMDEINDPKVFKQAVYYGSKIQLGGEMIRDIPFQYASAAISTSVHQLTQGGPPAALKRDEFGPDRDKLKAITAELRKEGEELGMHKPETIKKAKDQIMATKAKVEATFPQGSKERLDAEKYIKALYGLASMLETPAVNVLLAGVEKRPEANLGDLMGFMADYNLRFGAAETPRQREIYSKLYPMIAKIRAEVVPNPGPGTTQPTPSTFDHEAPGAAFEGLGSTAGDKKVPPPPAPSPK